VFATQIRPLLDENAFNLFQDFETEVFRVM
jgi:hypothetical protein